MGPEPNLFTGGSPGHLHLSQAGVLARLRQLVAALLRAVPPGCALPLPTGPGIAVRADLPDLAFVPSRRTAFMTPPPDPGDRGRIVIQETISRAGRLVVDVGLTDHARSSGR
jgi:hypothetical protein